MIEAVRFSSVEEHRTRQVVNSALWAAAGDALGWITELGDERTVKRRAKSSRVTKTIAWERRIGGKFGPTVKLPVGAISDDTQLRLAVSRSIRPNGDFDVETFAKVELPVWTSYSLGAGKGTTAAASNLSKSSATWFSNFFGKVSDRGGYTSAGGNGAAMRIQPHVWKSIGRGRQSFLRDVFRDAIVTHGSPRGFMGAVFHALCLDFSLTQLQVPGPEEWLDFAKEFSSISDIVRRDDQLALFWLRQSVGDVRHRSCLKALAGIGPTDHLSDEVRQQSLNREYPRELVAFLLPAALLECSAPTEDDTTAILLRQSCRASRVLSIPQVLPRKSRHRMSPRHPFACLAVPKTSS